jgi:hypothetical protein
LTERNTGSELKAGRKFTKPMAPRNRQEKQYLYQSRLQTYIEDEDDIKKDPSY